MKKYSGMTLTTEILAKMKNGVIASSLSDTDFKEPAKVKGYAIPKELYEGWDALSKAKGDKLQSIRDNDATLFCVIYNDRWGKYPKDFKNMDHNVNKIYSDALLEYKVDTMSKMTFDELTKQNLLNDLRTLAPEVYKVKYFTKFGVYPKF